MWNYRVVFSIIRNDKYMPTPRINREQVCEKRGNFRRAYLAYLRAVNDGEQSFAGEQLRNSADSL